MKDVYAMETLKPRAAKPKADAIHADTEQEEDTDAGPMPRFLGHSKGIDRMRDLDSADPRDV